MCIWCAVGFDVCECCKKLYCCGCGQVLESEEFTDQLEEDGNNIMEYNKNQYVKHKCIKVIYDGKEYDFSYCIECEFRYDDSDEE